MKEAINTLKNLTILYVEDEDFARNEMIEVLSFVFKEIIPASDGLEGFEKYKENQDKIDIILSDINMPKLNGIDMMKKIRELNSSVPTVFLTAHGENNYLFEAINMQIAQYIIKPMNGGELLEKLYTSYLPSLYKKQIEEKIERIKKEQEKTKSMNELFNKHTISLELTLEGKITYISNMFLTISDFKDYDLIGEHYSIVRDDFKENEFDKIKESIKDKGYWKSQVKNKKKTGRSYWLDSLILPILDENEEIEGYKSIEVDITNIKKIEDTLSFMLEEDESLLESIYKK